MFRKPKHDPRIERLSRIALLRDCSREELAAVARVTTPVVLAPGAALCTEGTAGAEVFIIASGIVEVVVDSRKVATLGQGDVCGEMALLDGAPRTASVTALSPTEVLVLSAQEFDRFLAVAPTAARRVTAACSARRSALAIAG